MQGFFHANTTPICPSGVERVFMRKKSEPLKTLICLMGSGLSLVHQEVEKEHGLRGYMTFLRYMEVPIHSLMSLLKTAEIKVYTKHKNLMKTITIHQLC